MAETTATFDTTSDLTNKLLKKEINNKNESFSEAFLNDNPNYVTQKEFDIKAGNYTLSNRLDPKETYYDRTLGYSPNFNAIDPGQDMGLAGNGNIGIGRGGKRDYYFVTDQDTGEIQIVRKGQFGNDDVIGSVVKNEDGSSSFVPFEGSEGRNGTINEIEHFSKPENITKVKEFANDVALNEYNKLSESEKENRKNPTDLIFNEEDAKLRKILKGEDDLLGNPLNEETGEFEGSKTLEAREKYRKDLEYPLGIADLPQDKLRISVVKFEPAQSQGSITLDKLKQANLKNLASGTNIFFSRTVTKTQIKGDSPFMTKRKGFMDRTILGGVTLPIPDGVTDQNRVSFGEGTMNPLQMAGQQIALDSLLKGLDAGGEKLADVFKTAADEGNLPTGIANLLTGSALGVNPNELLARTSGQVFNNNLQLLFQGPTLRPFNFQYIISPRDAKESQEVLRIIRMFKQSMAVQRDDIGIFLGSPNTYFLEFLNPVDFEHDFLPKIKECALLGFQVNYMPNNTYMTYDEDFSMVSYQLNFSFKELDPIFNDDYENMKGDDAQDTNIGF